MKHEQNFKDKHVFYKWTIDDSLEELYRMQSSTGNALQNDLSQQSNSDLMPSLSDLQNAIFLLSTLGPDSLFHVILAKAYALS